jgi:hypothetical protein
MLRQANPQTRGQIEPTRLLEEVRAEAKPTAESIVWRPEDDGMYLDCGVARWWMRKIPLEPTGRALRPSGGERLGVRTRTSEDPKYDGEEPTRPQDSIKTGAP